MRVIMGLLGVLAFLALTSAQDNHSKQKRPTHGGPKMVPVPVPIPVPVHHHHHHPVVMPAGSNNYQEWTGASGQLFPEAHMIQESQDNGFFDPRGLRDYPELHQPVAYPRYSYQQRGYEEGRPRKSYYSATAHSGERSGGEGHQYGPSGAGGDPRGHRRRFRPSRPEMESQVPGPMKPAESYPEGNEW